VVAATRDADYLACLEDFDVLAPDGHPVRWLMNRLYNLNLDDRVCGTDLMDQLCAESAAQHIGIYLYGSTTEVNAMLRARLQLLYPGLIICGSEPSAFRPLTPTEDQLLVERVNASGAGVLFLGLGCPLQEQFAHAHRRQFHAVQVCVGAAFDFLAGNKRRAPRWMQSRGLEWVHRAFREPRRLLWRYLSTNTGFLWLMLFHR
jgi:N-acetylglucosaminyldiphosphoundecaprenol N-acetyl-beta-D-mannosaminyltransferase